MSQRYLSVLEQQSTWIKKSLTQDFLANKTKQNKTNPLKAPNTQENYKAPSDP